MAYSDIVKKRIIKCLPQSKRYGIFSGNEKTYEHICKDRADNFLDGKLVISSVLKREADRIRYDKDASSLNSSQVMCISFFKKFFESTDNEEILLTALRNSGLAIAEISVINDAFLEYVSDEKEGTVFDFYLKMSDGQNIYFEIKYTETGFGVANLKKDSNKYTDKWNNIYKNRISKSKYLRKSLSNHINDFYKNYQINRNILYLDNDRDICVFITPRENDQLDADRKYVDSFKSKNIKNIYWEDIIETIRSIPDVNKELFKYINMFEYKYLL